MKIYNLFIPAVCYSCRKRISLQRECLCTECLTNLKRKNEYLFGEEALGKKYFDKAVSMYHYNSTVRELIHDFKYKEFKVIGDFLAFHAVNVLKNDYSYFTNVDGLICVPMHTVQKRDRNFNQSVYLTKLIANDLNIKDFSSFVKKTTQTKKQALQGFEERLTNPKNSFKTINNDCFKDKNILIIDDVFTTGATVNELSRVVKNSGAKKVFIFTIASGDSERDDSDSSLINQSQYYNDNMEYYSL